MNIKQLNIAFTNSQFIQFCPLCNRQMTCIDVFDKTLDYKDKSYKYYKGTNVWKCKRCGIRFNKDRKTTDTVEYKLSKG